MCNYCHQPAEASIHPLLRPKFLPHSHLTFFLSCSFFWLSLPTFSDFHFQLLRKRYYMRWVSDSKGLKIRFVPGAGLHRKNPYFFYITINTNRTLPFVQYGLFHTYNYCGRTSTGLDGRTKIHSPGTDLLKFWSLLKIHIIWLTDQNMAFYRNIL